jgi:dienelactone hydrolase
MKRRKSFRLAAGAVSLLAGIGWHAAAIAGAEPATVYFASADGKTRLVGYLFAPSTGGPHPAVVMLHGRAGLYSSNVNAECTLVARERASPCNATSLSKRNAAWGAYWAERGYVALLPDSFGPRGRGHGFGRFTHGDPEREDVNERTVRPLDAEGALDYLRSRTDVVADRIYLQGWSNGASTTPGCEAGRRLSRRAGILSGMRTTRADFAGLQDGGAVDGSACLRRRRGFAGDVPPRA